MKITLPALSAILTAAVMAALVSTPANALSAKDCSAKYKDAKSAGTLAGKTWNDFRKLECASDAAPAAKADPVASAKTNAATTGTVPAAAPVKPAKIAATTPATATLAGVTFPSAIAASFAHESAGKARMHTCLAQYKSNKASNANGDLKWIQKNGGYYSECNKHLKS